LQNHPEIKKQGSFSMTVRKITKMAIIIALYVAMTFVFSFMSYGGVQFRVAEVLILLCFYRKDYAIPLIIACAIANIPSPLGIIDVGFGTLGTLVAVLGILVVAKFKKIFLHDWVALFVASLFPVFANAIFVGWEINMVFGDPFFAVAASVALGEFAVVSLFGVLMFSVLGKNKMFMRMIETNETFKSFDGPDEKD
jgi:uncharacterized membrane protein